MKKIINSLPEMKLRWIAPEKELISRCPNCDRFIFYSIEDVEVVCQFCSRLTQRAPDLGQAAANPGNDDVAPSG